MTNTQTKKSKHQRIKEHGDNLNAIFHTGIEPVALCKKLIRLEHKANYAATCLCNTNTLDHLYHDKPWMLKQTTEEEEEAFFGKIMDSLRKILKIDESFPIFINHDPRGYALKIKDSYMTEHNIKLHQDWGGYGIIAPDLTNE